MIPRFTEWEAEAEVKASAKKSGIAAIYLFCVTHAPHIPCPFLTALDPALMSPQVTNQDFENCREVVSFDSYLFP